MSQPAQPSRISVAVCTYRRPAMLRALLDELVRLEAPQGAQWCEVLVVDNDPEASARDVVEAAAPALACELRWVHEPRSGVGHARNRCLAEARGDWLAFIDDDEYPDPAWLRTLWATADRHALDGVFGPVLAEFAQPPSAELLASGAHQRPRFATGTLMRWGDCRSGNVLFRRALADRVGGFDLRFAASGGEDCDFFWRSQAAGARLAWCDEAIVHEHVPVERMARGWLLRRSFNGGRNFARLRGARGGWRSLAGDALWGAANVLVYALPAVLARAMGHRAALHIERKLAGGLGKLTGPFAGSGGDYGQSSQPAARSVAGEAVLKSTRPGR